MKRLAAVAVSVISILNAYAFQAPPNLNGTGVPFTLGGKVVTADGSPVPNRVGMFLVCGGVRIAVTYADSKGNFGFPKMTSAFQNCMVHANIAGYRSDEVDATPMVAAGNPNIGNVLITKGGSGVLTSATANEAPKGAKKSFDKGTAALKAGNTEDAIKAFEAATADYPHYADAWYQLGLARLQAKEYDPAQAAFLKAAEADELLVGPFVQLGLLAGQKKDWAASAKYLDKALELDADDFPAAWFPDAVANSNLKNLEVAERSAREALKRDPKHANPRIEYLLGLILSDKGDYAGAAASLKDYLSHSPNAADVARVREMITSFEQHQ